ncbi:MAG TPA: 2-C-methyl-D-erythritol 2,4-cyclodiphosphate synthase [Cytophagales bacterium]|nr:2-C-methyl-D-erythritol 2,4-cyclodiphosphate synthase [Cytophagales bacterium]
MKYRIGHGYNVYQLKEKQRFRLGGVEIPREGGVIGFSDSDVMIHSICDALIGASNLEDVELYFPDKLNKYKAMDSILLLGRTIDLVRSEGFEIGNIDVILLLQSADIASFIPEMRKVLAKILLIRERDISIKAAAAGPLGVRIKDKEIAAYTIAMVYNIDMEKENFHLRLTN